MSGLYVSIEEVRQVFSTSTRAMSTTLVIDVFGHPVEIVVDDPVLRRVIDAAVAGEGRGVPVDNITAELTDTTVHYAPLPTGRDPTIPVPEEGKVPAPPVEGDFWKDTETDTTYRFTNGEWALAPTDGDLRVSVGSLERFTTPGIPQAVPEPRPPRVVPVVRQNVDEDGFEAM